MIAPNASDQWWNRNLTFLPTVEALVFASAGFLYGREVHRERAEKAEIRADKNLKNATEAIDKGQALKRDITKLAEAYSKHSKAFDILSSLETHPTILEDIPSAKELGNFLEMAPSLQSDLIELKDKANEYFPNHSSPSEQL